MTHARSRTGFPSPGRVWLGAPCLALALLPGACTREPRDEAPGPAASADEAPPLATSWQRPREKLLSVGEPAPDFVALAHTGHQIHLSSFLHRPTVVYFQPGVGGPDAAALAESIRNVWLSLRDRVGMVLGVTPEDNVTHRAFAADRDLPFLMISDVDRAIARSFGVSLDDGREGNVTFIVGTDGKVLRVFEGVRPGGHAKALVEAVGQLSPKNSSPRPAE